MMRQTISDTGVVMQQRTDAWLRVRGGKITGSRFARAVAAKNSSTYRNFIDQLVEERRQGRSLDSDYMSPAMQWGVDHEDRARKWYSKQAGCRVEQIAFVPHPEIDYVGVSPDGLVARDGLIEIKCPQMKGFRQVMDTRQMPTRYRWQVQGGLWVCQRQWADFICFYPPAQGIILRYDKDEEDWDRLESRCREINREVERRLAARRPRRTEIPSAPSIANQARATPAMAPAFQEAGVNQDSGAKRSGGIPFWVWLILIGAIVKLLIHL